MSERQDAEAARLAALRDVPGSPKAPTQLADALASHLMAFVAKESRQERRLVELPGG